VSVFAVLADESLQLRRARRDQTVALRRSEARSLFLRLLEALANLVQVVAEVINSCVCEML
jgi:hypothetical protein